MNAQDVARKVLDHYDGGKGWTQHAYRWGGQMCLVGALGNFLYGLDYDQRFSFQEERALEGDPATQLLAKIIREQYPERVHPLDMSSDVSSIIDFNDDELTTYTDIERVLEKMAAAQEEM